MHGARMSSAGEQPYCDEPEPYEDVKRDGSVRADQTPANGAATGSHRPSLRSQTESAWPVPLAEGAFHGLVGRIVREIEPNTEADPAAILVQLLAAFGNAVGPRPHFLADGSRHGGKLFVAIVGKTSKGRKGTSWNRTREVFERADRAWIERITSGLSSGEGLVWQVRDPIVKKYFDKRTGEYEEIIDDPGIDDKRLLVVESELASPLAAMARHGNTLSATLRQAWDQENLGSLTKNSPAKATGAHITVIGHVTRDELLRVLNRTEVGNGFANRFLWIAVKRSRILAFGGGKVDLVDHAADLGKALEFARGTDVVEFAPDARPLWERVYPDLSGERPGILGAVTARAEAQVVRISTLYAFMDRRRQIEAIHLTAALALWDYALASARWIWGDVLGDPTADTLFGALRGAYPAGLTGTQIRDLFAGHQSDDVARVRTMLVARGLVRVATEPTGGRPVQRWFAVAPAPEGFAS
jgi:hypothetical protein